MHSIYVVRGSENAAAIADERWSDLERKFFVDGAVLDDNFAAHAPATTKSRRWLWLALVTTALLCLAALAAS